MYKYDHIAMQSCVNYLAIRRDLAIWLYGYMAIWLYSCMDDPHSSPQAPGPTLAPTGRPPAGAPSGAIGLEAPLGYPGEITPGIPKETPLVSFGTPWDPQEPSWDHSPGPSLGVYI